MRTLLWKTGRRWWLQANLVELTFRVSHFLHGCWSDHDRHGNVEAQDFCCHVDMGHIDQYTRSEPEIICQGRTKMKSKTAMTLQDRTTTMWILISYFDQGISAHACIYHHDVVYLLSEFLTKLSSTLTIRTTYDNKTRLISCPLLNVMRYWDPMLFVHVCYHLLILIKRQTNPRPVCQDKTCTPNSGVAKFPQGFIWDLSYAISKYFKMQNFHKGSSFFYGILAEK